MFSYYIQAFQVLYHHPLSHLLITPLYPVRKLKDVFELNPQLMGRNRAAI